MKERRDVGQNVGTVWSILYIYGGLYMICYCSQRALNQNILKRSVDMNPSDFFARIVDCGIQYHGDLANLGR